MSGDIQDGNLENQLEEEELSRDASQRIEGRTSDLYTTQTSNDGMDYISNLPRLVIRGIVKYLDGESLWKCSRDSHKWKAVIDYTDRWEPICRSLNIPKCRYFEHEFLSQWTQWTTDCGQSGHTWQRAYHREKEVENKWRSGQIEIRELANISVVIRIPNT
ncbi:hypothetical protein ACTXT7_001316 [Hymenolepis weldensis]